MTKVATGRLDLSFLNEEEASKILAVLERDERLKRAERDRVSKLQSAKRDIKWLHGVTGEWFEEIQRKKFRNDPDVSSMLKQPLAYKLKKPAQNDLMDFRMSRTKSLQSHKNASSSSSILGFRSPFTSLFSFRKPQSQQQRHSIPSLSGHSASGTEEKTKMEVSNTLQSKRTDNLFGTKPGRIGGRGTSLTDTELENEVFLVLDDLDNKLAHEQTRGFTTHTTPRSYKSRGHYRSQYSMEGEYSDIWGQRKDYCKTSSMFLHEGRRKLSSNEEYRTCSTYRPWKFHDMYSNRHHTFSHHDHTRKDKFARSPSLCSISQSRPQSSPASFTTFSASSLHLPSLQQSNSRFLPSSGHQESKRKHVSSIMWNRPHCNESAQNRGILSKTQSLMELNSYDNQDTRPLPLQQNRVYEFYQSQSLYRRTMPKAYQFGRNQVTSPVFWDNSEHKQFYQSETGSNGRGISQEGIMEMETDRTWEAANKENHSYMNNIEKVPLPYKRSHSNPNNLLISVNEKQIAPANSTILHSQHNFASTSMLAGDDLVEEMKIDLDFQSLASENASNKEIAEEMRMPEISNSKADLQNQNSLSSNSTITLHSCAPDVSTTSASVESRNQIKLDEHHEGPVGNILDTDISVSQLQFPLTEGNTKMPFQAHLFENANMQLTRETHLPAFSNIIGDFQNSSHDGTLGASSACYFLDSRDQTKPSAQCNYSNMVMLGTDASNNDVKSLVTKMNIDNNTQMCVAKNKSKMDPLNRTGYCPANGMTVVTPQPIYSQAASRSTDIPNSHSSILASALQTPDNTNVLTVNILDFRGQSKKEPLQENEQASEYCETVYNEKDFKSTSRSNRYTSVLLLNESRHASPLSSLNQWKSFQRNSSEMNNMKLENMKRESTEKPTGPNSQTQEQSIVSRGLQMDAVNATGTTTVLSSSSSNALTDHKDLLPGFSKVSSEHSQSFLPDLSPSINFTYLNTPTVSSLNCKSTDPLNMGGKVPLTRCRSEENISFELNKKQIGVANEDHYSQPTESYAQNKNETTHAPSFSDAQDQQVISKKSLLLRKIFFSDPNNRQHTKLTISHKPSRLVLPDVKTTKEGNLNILVPDSLAQTSSNHEHPISVDTVPATSTLSQNLNLISANGNRENRLQNSPDLTGHKQMESQWSDKRTSSNEDVEPYYNIASSEVSSVSNEFAEQKRIHSAVPEEPFTIIPNVTECKPNNSNSPEKENKHLSSSGSRNTNEKLEMLMTNSNASVSRSQDDATSIKPFAIYYSLRKSAEDISRVPENKNTAISSSSKKPLFPRRRTLDHLPAQIFNRIVAPFSHQKNISTVSISEHSSTDVNENTTQEKDLPVPPEVRKYELPAWNPNSSDSVSFKADESVGLEKENNLQKHEASSTVSLSSAPDNTDYLQLRSVYGSLPHKHSKALCDVLLNRTNANLLNSNSSRNKNYEFHIKLATISFPDSLNPDTQESADKILSDSTTQQQSNGASKPTIRKSASNEEEHNPLPPNSDQPLLLSRTNTFVIPDPAEPDVSVQAPTSSSAVEKSLNVAPSVTDTTNIRTYLSIIPRSQVKADGLHTRTPLHFSSSATGKATFCQEQETAWTAKVADQLQIRDLENWQQLADERGNNCRKSVLQVCTPEDSNSSHHEGKNHTDIKPEATYSRIFPGECGLSENLETNQGGKRISPDSDGSSLNRRKSDPSRSTTHAETTSNTTVVSNTNNSSLQVFCEEPTSPVLQRFQPRVRKISETKASYGPYIIEQEPMSEEQTSDRKVTDLQRSMEHFEDAHNDCLEDDVFTAPAKVQLSTKTNYNSVIFDYISYRGRSINERINERLHKTNWEHMYPTTNTHYSNQNLSQNLPASIAALHKEGNITHLDIGTPQSTSPLPNPLQLLHKSGNYSPVKKNSSDVTTILLEKTNQNILKDRGKAPSNTTDYSEKSRKSETSDGKCSTVEEIAGRTKRSSCSTELQNELTAARTRNSQMFTVAAESPGENCRFDAYHSPLLISSIDNNCNTITEHSLQPNSCLNQEAVPLSERGGMNVYQDAYQSESLKNVNFLDDEAEVKDMRRKHGRHFSARTCVDKAYNKSPSPSTFSPDRKHRNFSSFSELPSNEVNDNWTLFYNRNQSYSPRKIKSIDFGIFGKEQQAAFLRNIRRSLTEGRLWRPCFLKNPGFFRSEASDSSNRSGFLNASSAGSRLSVGSLREPLNIYREESVIYSESDNDTTTDDEYYLDDYDKESEL